MATGTAYVIPARLEDAFVASFGDNLELCSHFVQQSIHDFAVTSLLAGATRTANVYPWASHAFTVTAAGFTPSDAASSLFASQDEPICRPVFDTWEAI